MPTVEERLRYWRDRATAAEARIAELEASEKRMREALEPFAEVSEKDIGDDEDDADWFRTMERRHARGPIITVGHFRRARAAIAKEGE